MTYREDRARERARHVRAMHARYREGLTLAWREPDRRRAGSYTRQIVTRDMSIALAGISLPILGVLMARWNETHEALRHHVFNVLRLALAVIGLAVSTVGGAVVLGDPDSEPSYVFVLVQSLAVTWGLMYAAYPLLLDLAADLRQAMPVRLWRLLTSALSVLIMLGAVVLLFVTLPWWYTLSYVVAILVVVLPLVMIWENKARPAIARWLESPEDDAERPRRT